MPCLSDLSTHVVLTSSLALSPVEDPDEQARLFRSCSATQGDRRAIAGWQPWREIRYQQMLFSHLEIRDALWYPEQTPDTPWIPYAWVPAIAEWTAAEVPHLLVSSRGLLSGTPGLRVRSWSVELPPGSLQLVDEAPAGLVAPSPEFHLLSRASRLDLVTLTRVVCEYCGSYRTRPDAKAGLVSKQRALTSCDALGSYVAKAPPRTPGARALAQAARLAFDKAASPREAALALLLSMPQRLGGFGLPRPELNRPLELTDADSDLLGQRKVRADLRWPGTRAAIEYQGAGHEETTDQDNLRHLTHNLEEVDVLQVTPQLVGTWTGVAAVARWVEQRVHPRRPVVYEENRPAQEALRKQLMAFDFPW